MATLTDYYGDEHEVTDAQKARHDDLIVQLGVAREEVERCKSRIGYSEVREAEGDVEAVICDLEALNRELGFPEAPEDDDRRLARLQHEAERKAELDADPEYQCGLKVGVAKAAGRWSIVNHHNTLSREGYIRSFYADYPTALDACLAMADLWPDGDDNYSLHSPDGDVFDDYGDQQPNHDQCKWYTDFLSCYHRRTGSNYEGHFYALIPFLNCNYLPETAVYELTGQGVEAEPVCPF